MADFEIRGPHYLHRVRVIAPDFVYFEREQILSGSGSRAQFDAFGPSWTLAIADCPPGRVSIRSGDKSIPAEGKTALFLPPFSMIEWELGPGTLKWEAFMSERPLPADLPGTAFIFPWKATRLPETDLEIHDLLRNAPSPRIVENRSSVTALALRLKSEIDRTYASEIHLSEIADRFGVSRVSMGRAFKTAFGLTPVAYRSHLRVFHSLRLLRQGSDVTTAAYGCGFANLSQYQRQFQSHLAIPPREYCLGKKRDPQRNSTMNSMDRSLHDRAESDSPHRQQRIRRPKSPSSPARLPTP